MPTQSRRHFSEFYNKKQNRLLRHVRRNNLFSRNLSSFYVIALTAIFNIKLNASFRFPTSFRNTGKTFNFIVNLIWESRAVSIIKLIKHYGDSRAKCNLQESTARARWKASNQRFSVHTRIKMRRISPTIFHVAPCRRARAETFIQHPISSVINCRMSYTVLIQRPERNVSSPSPVSNLHHLITQDAMLALEFVSFSEERRVLEWNRHEAMKSFQPKGEWIVRNAGHRVAARTIDWLCLSCKLKP